MSGVHKVTFLELISSGGGVAEKALYIPQTFKELTVDWTVRVQLIALFIDNPIPTEEETGVWGKHEEVSSRAEG